MSNRLVILRIKTWIVACFGLMLLAGAGTMPSGLAASTYEAWDFHTAGTILAMSTTADVSNDGVDDLVVAALDKSIYMVDGVTGERIWSYTAGAFYLWEAIASLPAVDANDNGKSDILVSTKERLVLMLDGSNGNQLWKFNTTDSDYKLGNTCSLSVRSVQFASDLDGDALPDPVIVSDTGDACTKDDKFTVLGLSSKTGQTLWEYVHEEDYHGLKDGTRGSAPVTVIDVSEDGTKDVAVVDELGSLYVINGLNGNLVRKTELDVFGSIWSLVEIPDINGDGRADVIALEFIEGGGGPDYASINAIDLTTSRVLWEVEVGDGLYDGGALYSATWVSDTPSAGTKVATFVAVTQRLEDKLDLVLLDAKTSEEAWRFGLGEERSRKDLEKYYPVARIADAAGRNDELAVGSIDSIVHLFDAGTGSSIWTHPINGEIRRISFVPAEGTQKYIVVEDEHNGVRALSRQTTIETTLSIELSAQTVIESTKLVVTGAVSPPFPGEIIQLRYIDPSGAMTSRTVVADRDGTYTDVIEPERLGSWKVSADFTGEGLYLDSKSRTVSFNVVGEVKNSVYSLKVPGQQGETSYPIAYFIEGGQLSGMTINKEQKSLNIAFIPSSENGGALRVELPRGVIDSWDSTFQVYMDGKETDFEEIAADTNLRTLSIPFEGESRQVQIIGTYIVPEFSAIAPAILAVTMVAAIVAVGMRARLAPR